MTTLGARVLDSPPQIVGRVPNDYAEELQRFLDQLGDFSDVVNTFLDEVSITEGGGTVTVELPGSGHARTFMLMGG